jgi:hypothetical protein
VPERYGGQAAIDRLAEAASVEGARAVAECEDETDETGAKPAPGEDRKEWEETQNEDNLEICSSCSRRCHHIAGGGTD